MLTITLETLLNLLEDKVTQQAALTSIFWLSNYLLAVESINPLRKALNITAAPIKLYAAIAEIISIEGFQITPEMVIPSRTIIATYPPITKILTTGVGALILILRFMYQNKYRAQTTNEYKHEILLTTSSRWGRKFNSSKVRIKMLIEIMADSVK